MGVAIDETSAVPPLVGATRLLADTGTGTEGADDVTGADGEIHRAVDSDSAQPTADAAPAKRGQVPVGAEEGLLHGIGGLIAVRDEPVHQCEQMVLVSKNQLVEGVELAA